MKRFLLALIAFFLSHCVGLSPALAASQWGPQSAPNWGQGYVPSMAQWNMAFANKMDYSPALAAFVGLSGTINQIPYFSGINQLAAAAASGDCTNTAMAFVCTKTNGVSFAPSATTDATNAANISSGTLGVARLPALGGGNVSCASAGGNCTIGASQVTNAMHANMAANTVKCNPTGSGAAPSDCTPAQVSALTGQGWILVTATGVNFNSANTDTALNFSSVLPSGSTRVLVSNVYISGASASLTAATVGVFTATSAGGVAVVTSGTAVTVSTASDATNNNAQVLPVNNSNTEIYTASNLATPNTFYFRVQTPEGSAATANVTLFMRPLP